jgi:hypothetical protein
MRKNLFESEPVRSGIKPAEWYDVNDIRNEKWIHPHLCKELKTKIKNQ